MFHDPWAPRRNARLAREAAEAAEAERIATEQRDAERELVAATLATHPELVAREPAEPGRDGRDGIDGRDAAPAPRMIRAELERDWVQAASPATGELVWAELIVGATLHYDDGSTEHSTVVRDAKGRPESVVTDAAQG